MKLLNFQIKNPQNKIWYCFSFIACTLNPDIQDKNMKSSSVAHQQQTLIAHTGSERSKPHLEMDYANPSLKRRLNDTRIFSNSSVNRVKFESATYIIPDCPYYIFRRGRWFLNKKFYKYFENCLEKIVKIDVEFEQTCSKYIFVMFDFEENEPKHFICNLTAIFARNSVYFRTTKNLESFFSFEECEKIFGMKNIPIKSWLEITKKMILVVKDMSNEAFRLTKMIKEEFYEFRSENEENLSIFNQNFAFHALKCQDKHRIISFMVPIRLDNTSDSSSYLEIVQKRVIKSSILLNDRIFALFIQDFYSKESHKIFQNFFSGIDSSLYKQKLMFYAKSIPGSIPFTNSGPIDPRLGPSFSQIDPNSNANIKFYIKHILINLYCVRYYSDNNFESSNEHSRINFIISGLQNRLKIHEAIDLENFNIKEVTKDVVNMFHSIFECYNEFSGFDFQIDVDIIHHISVFLAGKIMNELEKRIEIDAEMVKWIEELPVCETIDFYANTPVCFD